MITNHSEQDISFKYTASLYITVSSARTQYLCLCETLRYRNYAVK